MYSAFSKIHWQDWKIMKGTKLSWDKKEGYLKVQKLLRDRKQYRINGQFSQWKRIICTSPETFVQSWAVQHLPKQYRKRNEYWDDSICWDKFWGYEMSHNSNCLRKVKNSENHKWVCLMNQQFSASKWKGKIILLKTAWFFNTLRYVTLYNITES